MKNTVAIKDICKQIAGKCMSVVSLIDGMEDTKKSTYSVLPVYEDMILDDITHVQQLTLELTRAATGELTNVPDKDEAYVVAAAVSIGNEAEQTENEEPESSVTD